MPVQAEAQRCAAVADAVQRIAKPGRTRRPPTSNTPAQVSCRSSLGDDRWVACATIVSSLEPRAHGELRATRRSPRFTISGKTAKRERPGDEEPATDDRASTAARMPPVTTRSDPNELGRRDPAGADVSVGSSGPMARRSRFRSLGRQRLDCRTVVVSSGCSTLVAAVRDARARGRRPPPRRAGGIPARAQMKAIVRAWSNRLNAGDDDGVAHLFRLPAVVIQNDVYRFQHVRPARRVPLAAAVLGPHHVDRGQGPLRDRGLPARRPPGLAVRLARDPSSRRGSRSSAGRSSGGSRSRCPRAEAVRLPGVSRPVLSSGLEREQVVDRLAAADHASPRRPRTSTAAGRGTAL